MRKKTKILLSLASVVAITATTMLFAQQVFASSADLGCDDHYYTTCKVGDEYCYFWLAIDGSLCYKDKSINRVPSAKPEL